MKIVAISFVLFCQLIVYEVTFAEPEKIEINGSIEKDKPTLIEDPFLQAEHLFHSGEFLAAKPFYHDYLSRNRSGKSSHQALFRLGSIDQSVNSFATAVRFYQMLIQDFPRSLLVGSARYNMAVCHYELEDYKRAETVFNMVLRFSSDKIGSLLIILSNAFVRSSPVQSTPLPGVEASNLPRKTQLL